MRRRDPALLRLLHFEYDECCLCGVTYPLHLHHVVFKSHDGDDTRANILALCLNEHEFYHRGDPAVKQRLAEHLLAERPDVVEYLREMLGDGGAEVWMERHGV